MAESNVSGSGVHPGKPIIWPTGKGSASSSQNSQSSAQLSSQQVAQTGGAKASVSTAQSAASQGATQASATQAAAAGKAQAKPSSPVSRPQTMQDIASLLLSNNIPDTPANRNIAMNMLNRGFELSRANFVRVLSNLEGTDKSQQSLESALVMLGKEIDSQPGMKLISNQLQNNPQLTQQLEALAHDLATTSGVIKALSSSGVMGKLAEILSELDKKLSNFADKYKFTGDASLTREELMNDLRAIRSLAEGIKEQAQSAEGAKQTQQAAIEAALEQVSKRASQVLDNLTAQAILSKPTDKPDKNFVVYNVPNPAANGEDVVIQIRRDGSGPKAEVDASKTQISLSMGTKNMGRLNIILSVRDVENKKNVAAIFNAESDEVKNYIAENSGDFLKSMAEKECIVTSFHSVKNPDLTITDFYIPKVGLDNLLKIDVEA